MVFRYVHALGNSLVGLGMMVLLMTGCVVQEPPALEDISQARRAMEAAKVEAEKQATASAAKLKQVQALKAAADKNVAAVKKANAPKDLAFVAISTPVRVRIVDSPLEVTATAPAEAVMPGGKVEIATAIKRLYGFADKVDLTLEVPKSVTGLGIKNFSLEKDKLEGKFEVTAGDKTPPGDHTVTVKAKAKFNAVDVETSTTFVLKVAPKAEPPKAEPAKAEPAKE